MSKIIYFNSHDNNRIEFITKKAKKPEKTVIVWPCTMGDIRMYKSPLGQFADRGCTTILYNPKGHGNSEGQFKMHEAVDDLENFLSEFNTEKSPVTAVGHSGGCGGLLTLANRVNISKFFLVSPVLDSRKSMFHMYKNNTISEFSMMLAASSTDEKQILSILKTENWLFPDYWNDNDLKSVLNSISSTFHIGSFLDKLFITGFNTYKELEERSHLSELLLPSIDNWYPLDSTTKFAKKHNITINNSLGASDHYFTGAWRNTWSYIIDSI